MSRLRRLVAWTPTPARVVAMRPEGENCGCWNTARGHDIGCKRRSVLP